MQQADGQVLIRAEMDTASVTAGIAEMQAALEQLRVHAQKQLASIRAGVQSEGNTLGGWMPSLASRLIGALTAGLSGGGTRITNTLRAVLASAYSGGSTYTARFSGIGSNVIAGIIGGIQGSASALWSTLREVAANMLNTLKSSLGIHSPSQIMREEIGRQIGAGIAAGMLDSRDAIVSASETLSDDALVQTMRIRTDRVSAAQISGDSIADAARMLRGAASTPAAAVTAVSVIPAFGCSGSQGTAGTKPTPTVSGNTFIFEKPVETPYRHAQAIREVMEEMLYGT